MTTCPRSPSLAQDLLSARGDEGDDSHLRTCEDCRATVERVRRFDASLRSATRTLVQEALPPARLLLNEALTERSYRVAIRPRTMVLRSLGAVALLGATVWAIAFVTASLVPSKPPSSGVGAGDAGCDRAFGAWTAAWTAAGGPEMEGGTSPDATPPPLEVGEGQLRKWLAYERQGHALTVVAFEACTRDALRSANARLLVSRKSPTGQVAQPFISRFDETVQSWCDGDRSLSGLSACR